MVVISGQCLEGGAGIGVKIQGKTWNALSCNAGGLWALDLASFLGYSEVASNTTFTVEVNQCGEGTTTRSFFKGATGANLLAISYPSEGASVTGSTYITGTCSRSSSSSLSVLISGFSAGSSTTCQIDNTWAENLNSLNGFSYLGLNSIFRIEVSQTGPTPTQYASFTMSTTPDGYSGTNLEISSPAASSSITGASTLSGTCNSGGLDVRIKDNGGLSATCNSGTWAVNFSDLPGYSGLSNGSMDIEVSQTNRPKQFRSFNLNE